MMTLEQKIKHFSHFTSEESDFYGYFSIDTASIIHFLSADVGRIKKGVTYHLNGKKYLIIDIDTTPSNRIVFPEGSVESYFKAKYQ